MCAGRTLRGTAIRLVFRIRVAGNSHCRYRRFDADDSPKLLHAIFLTTAGEEYSEDDEEAALDALSLVLVECR